MPVAPKARGTRTCVSCRKQDGKIALLRIVRLADGSVAYDATGRVPGRGAYVCSASCLDAALKSGKLQRALKATIQEEEARSIVECIADATRA